MSNHDKSSVEPALHIVTSDAVHRKAKNRPIRISKKRQRSLAVVLVVLAAVAGLYIYYRANANGTDKAVRVPTYQEALNSQLQAIKDRAPGRGASTAEQTKYYDKLMLAYAANNDYKNAVATFEKRTAISTAGLTYTDYMNAALYYHKLGDQANTAKAFNNAKTVVPANGDPASGYTKATILKRIEASRTELGL